MLRTLVGAIHTAVSVPRHTTHWARCRLRKHQVKGRLGAQVAILPLAAVRDTAVLSERGVQMPVYLLQYKKRLVGYFLLG